MNALGITVSICAILQVVFVGSKTCDCLEIISRTSWGAKPPKAPLENLAEKPAPYVIIHHSDTPACTTQAICQAKVRSFQDYHMNSKHWDDIGYNFLIGEDGHIYEGRGWNKRGAHSKSYNSKSIGICFIGNFTHRPPNGAAITSAKKLIAYGINATEIASTYTLLGHRQTTPTTCPGDSFYNLIKTWDHWSENP